MQYYASHYLWHAGQDKLFRMQRIGLEVSGRTWVSMEPLEEEVRNTQWLGGLIVLAASDSELRKGETFQEFRARTASAVTGDQPLYAFHVPFLICRRWNLPNGAVWCVYDRRRRNSAHTMAVATATFNDSLVSFPCG